MFTSIISKFKRSLLFFFRYLYDFLSYNVPGLFSCAVCDCLLLTLANIFPFFSLIFSFAATFISCFLYLKSKTDISYFYSYLYCHCFISCSASKTLRLTFQLLLPFMYVVALSSTIILLSFDLFSFRSSVPHCRQRPVSNLHQVRNLDTGQCVDSAAKPEDNHKPVGLWPCHNQGGNQVSFF